MFNGKVGHVLKKRERKSNKKEPGQRESQKLADK